jgi:NAD(P)-dependent dehydrogenase (short-subunit alcohol dehydrogenase family)
MLDSGLMDKVVLITGANHGIDAAIVRALRSQDTKPFFIYLGVPRQTQ